MKSIRLNVNMRDDMIDRMREKFEEVNPCPYTQEDVNVIKGAVAERFYQKFIGKYLPLMEQLPQQFLSTSGHFSVAVEQGNVQTMNRYDSDGYLKNSYIFRNGSYNQYPLGTVTQEEYKEYCVAGKKEDKEIADWLKSRDTFLSEARQILDSVNTSGQLHEVWPEGCDYLPPHVADPSVGLANFPALSTSRLNTMLGK